MAELVSAQFYFFGRNKIQYDDFDWKVIKTEHFDIYYYGEFEELAEIGANYAEEAFKELKVKFNHIVVSRIPLIFYNTHIHFQQTNVAPYFIPEGVGGFFEFMKGRVVIPYLGDTQKFRHVIRHELVHVFMTSKILNLLKDHRNIKRSFPPLWFVEGLAEYWSYHWDTQAEIILRDAILNDSFVPLKDMLRIRGSFQMYKEGQNFLEFVSETYGEEKILLLMENFWRYNKFEEILEYTLNETIEEIDDKWLFSLKQKYYPLYKNKYPHHIYSKKLTDFGFNFSPKYLSRNGEENIYFVSNRGGYTGVYGLEYNSENQEMLDPALLLEGGKESVFESFHILQTALDVSDDGYIAFVTKSGATDALHIYDIDNDEVINTFQYQSIITMTSPMYSNDNKKIVFSGADRKGFTDIYILNVDDGQITRVTNDYYNDIDPIFNKDNNSIVFASDRTEGDFQKKYNIFEFNLTDKTLNYLTYVNADLSKPHFNTEYSELYFNSNYDGINNIWKLKRDLEDNPIGMTQYSHFLTSVFDYTFVDKDKIITSGFEKFSFQFYELDLNKIPDSTKKFVSFNFDFIGEGWYAKKIDAIPEKNRFEYEKEYTLDYAVSQVNIDPTFGARGGAVLQVTDLLGDDKYYFLIYNSAEVQSELLKNFNFAISRVNVKERVNFGYGIFHYNGRRYDIRESNDFFYERVYGGYFSLIFPFSQFNRLESSISLANSDKELETFISARKALLLTNSLSYVHDNSLWGPTGPMQGSRYRFMLSYTSDIRFSNVNYYSIMADLRKYYRLTLRSSIALRTALFVNHGREARRYIAGGSWDLRGWNRWSIRGQKLWLSSAEYRFPLVDAVYIRVPFFGLGVTNIRGAAFFDAGGAWDEKYNETIGSVGIGLRVNLFNIATIRYDVGKKIENNFKQFQPRLFWQFFFGWDF